jgi:hypothetical protein
MGIASIRTSISPDRWRTERSCAAPPRQGRKEAGARSYAGIWCEPWSASQTPSLRYGCERVDETTTETPALDEKQRNRAAQRRRLPVYAVLEKDAEPHATRRHSANRIQHYVLNGEQGISSQFPSFA